MLRGVHRAGRMVTSVFRHAQIRAKSAHYLFRATDFAGYDGSQAATFEMHLRTRHFEAPFPFRRACRGGRRVVERLD
jgi:hypothetical protein